MERTDRSWEDLQQFEVLETPDVSRPTFVFRDDEFDVAIRTCPAALPVWLAFDTTPHGLTEFFCVLPAQWLASRVDDRFKVVTFRQRSRRPSLPHVIGVELWETEEAAVARRVELLRTWQPGQSVGALPIGARERGRLRRLG